MKAFFILMEMRYHKLVRLPDAPELPITPPNDDDVDSQNNSTDDENVDIVAGELAALGINGDVSNTDTQPPMAIGTTLSLCLVLDSQLSFSHFS
jgi:hypothetical protein